MKIEGKFIFKVAGTLTAISLVVALLLGLTNMLTAEDVYKRQRRGWRRTYRSFRTGRSRCRSWRTPS